MPTTQYRNYPLPDPPNWVSDDVAVLVAAYTAIDADMNAVLQALNQKAAVNHTHTVSDISGLQNILDNKAAQNHTHSLGSLSDVTTTGVANGMVLAFAGGQWVASNAAALFGAHTHPISDIVGLTSALDAKIDVAVLNAAAVKLTPVDGDNVPITDSQGGNALKRLSWGSIKAALKSYFDTIYAPANQTVPPGARLDYDGASAPAGYLLCGGQAVSRTANAALYAAIGTTYGAGDGTTTFNVPNQAGKIIKT